MKKMPAYLNLLEENKLKNRTDQAVALLENCTLCPRRCGVNRLDDEKGACKSGRFAKVASHNLHFGEEPPITGTRGSGTIFFSGCNLKCIFCQNYPISQLCNGKIVKPKELAQMMLNLQKRGAHNINLVTPSHVVPQFLEGLLIAAKGGLKIPIVYNSNGYEGLEALKLLDGIVDIYMPDIKYASRNSAEKCSSAPNYWDHVRPTLKEMLRQVSPLELDDEEMAVRGLLIRHLVLPGDLDSSDIVFEFIAKELSKKVPVNLMSQYFPAHNAIDDPILNRRITKEEFARAETALHRWGLDEGWIQHL